jgi:uncharacterized integral membrane protein (TIGR00697 family)
MSNEALFLTLLAFALSLPVLAYKFGQTWMYVLVGINACILIPLAPLSANVFGYSVSLGTIYYATLFLATDLLAETYGKVAAYRAVATNIMTSYLLVGLIQIPLSFAPSAEGTAIHDAISASYAHSWRMVFMGTLCFALTQMIDVSLYDYLHKKTGEKLLWLRNNVSSISSALFANFFFWYFAFGNILNDWVASAWAGFALTAFVNLCDTPFIYLAKRLAPLDVRNKQ